MKIVSLEPSLESLFWETISQDIIHYYFFAFDWKYRRDQTKILLALDDGEIHGMMLIYRGEIVNLRGSVIFSGVFTLQPLLLVWGRMLRMPYKLCSRLP